MSRTPKEATIIILDVGKNTLAKSGANKSQTFFEQAKQCASKIIQRKIFSKPNDEIGLVLMGTDDTKNQLHEKLGGYDRICEKINLSMVNCTQLRTIENEISVSESTADWIDGLVVGLNFLKESAQAKKFASLKLVLISPLTSQIHSDDTDKIVDALNQMQVELNVINDNVKYVSSDEDDDFGRIYTQEYGIFSQSVNKTQQQAKNEEIITNIVCETNGVLCDIDSAELMLIHFQKKKSRAMPWNCPLTIGTKIKIFTSSYILVTEDKGLGSFKTEFVHKRREQQSSAEGVATEKIQENVAVPAITSEDVDMDTGEATNSIHATKYVTEYFKNDRPYEPDFDNLMKAYMYGTTVVPYDTTNVDYQSGEKCLSMIGFISKDLLFEEFLVGNGASIVTAQKGYDVSEAKLIALIQAMKNMNTYMLARRVYRNNSLPKIMVLIPNFRHKIPCLTMLETAYNEETVSFEFPSLRVKKFTPSTEQYQAIDNLIDSMDLMDAVDDGTGIREAFSLHRTLNPATQHIYRCLAKRAIDSNSPLLSVSEDLLELVDIPKKIKMNSKEYMDKVKEIFPLEVVEKQSEKWLKKFPKLNAEGATDENQPTNAESNIQQDENRVVLVEVGTVTPAEDFYTLLERGEKFATLCLQIQNVIYDLVINSMKIQTEKIFKAISIFRDEAKKMAPYKFNDWIKEFKTSLVGRGKVDFWKSVIDEEKLGLITSEESSLSTCTVEEAEQFYIIDFGVKISDSNEDNPPENIDDLFD
uniref:Putative x-ray repair complementing defective repair in chinese hamster cells 5 n=1 Tax=Corethrella appendiculata TaxID=1370023 RepID=U5EX40_9DIPT